VHDNGCAAPDPVKIARFQAEAAERARIHKAERLSKARWLRLHQALKVLAAAPN
jgi:hypothetical protein